jgi:outer membrane receptor for ferrienterochelin and colicin
MKNFIIISLLSLSLYSCVSIRFPESIKVDISIPENLDLEKVKVIIDTLRGVNLKGKNLDAVMEFNIIKKDLPINISEDINASVNSVFVIDSEKPLIIIDGQEQVNDNIVEILDPKKIETIEVYKDSIAIAKYGAKAKNGVVVIITKPKNNN